MRNTFITSQLTRILFHLFITRDGITGLIFSSILFMIGYRLGKNLDHVVFYHHHFSHWFLIIAISLGGQD